MKVRTQQNFNRKTYETVFGISIMSDGELAWSSFDKALRIITLNRCTIGERGGNIHRCQKPVKLYAEILRKKRQRGRQNF